MPFNVVGIGEVVWDVFPAHKHLGGAPYNFTFHCLQLSGLARIVSRIGDDDFGRRMMSATSAAGVDISYVQTDHSLPTGTVQVELSAGIPTYQICENTAWDFLQFTPELASLAQQVDAVCFGTLGQRNKISRNTIHEFLRRCPSSALKIFDVNLRQHFFSKELIESSLGLATVLKVSDEELPILADLFNLSGSVPDQLEQIIQRFHLQLTAYTRGAEGSILMTADERSEHPGCHGSIVDTVGAGDSFTAALCMGVLNGLSLDAINKHASRVASFVCSQKGATPALPVELTSGELYAKS